MELPQFTLNDYETLFADRHLLQAVVARWAKQKPQAAALIAADGTRTVTWREFDRFTSALACELLRLGFARGDDLVTLLPLSVEQVLLEYSCFKIGVIVAPLDLRQSTAGVLRALALLRPRGFVFQQAGVPAELRGIETAALESCPWIEHCMAFDSPDAAPGELAAMFRRAWRVATGETSLSEDDAATLVRAAALVNENDGAMVIFTTGSTGSPKPALLSHRNITSQCMCLSGALLGGDLGWRTLVHLPPSHVGCQTELLMSTLYGGGSAVLLEAFDAGRSLRAIAQHRVEILGQIPAMFNLEWMLKDFESADLSSLRSVFYGGNSVSRPFIDRVATMAPIVGTGLGLTESSGFCTYVLAQSGEHESVSAGLGEDMPIYPCTIRQSMREDRSAGDELAKGEIGHVCFHGPQTFLGYVNDPDATAKAVSRDGYLYTGDMGYRDAAGLHLTGRAKWVIKSLGYQIFPGDVEAHIATLTAKVANCVVVGVAHQVASEAIVAAVEKKPEAELTHRELDRHARSLPTYMRPRHWIILEPGQMPLNRVVKPDYLRVQEMARQEVQRLRANGEWDSGFLKAEWSAAED